MHEMSTCRSLINQIEKALQDHANYKISSVDVSIGQLANIDIDELKELFPMASKNTIAENVLLNIKTVSPDINCLDCGKTTLSKNKKLICQNCYSNNTIPLNGTDMLLTNIELECES
ncbi:MAG: hydrogenase maturation nickel metallochaperone HypA [Gammaproteobacteria bacterium]|nr:hydrogenase maturation nickel metallochaperone HypA [Gammaproteobacteria bacterium]